MRVFIRLPFLRLLLSTRQIISIFRGACGPLGLEPEPCGRIIASCNHAFNYPGEI